MRIQVVDIQALVDWQQKRLVMALFGLDVATRESVVLRVHGFQPYLFVQANEALRSSLHDQSSREQASTAIHQCLVRQVRILDHQRALDRRSQRAQEALEAKKKVNYATVDQAVEQTMFAIRGEGDVDNLATDRVTSVEYFEEGNGKFFSAVGYSPRPLEGLFKVTLSLQPYLTMVRDIVATETLSSLSNPTPKVLRRARGVRKATVFEMEEEEDDALDAPSGINPEWGLSGKVFGGALSPEYQFMVDYQVQGSSDILDFDLSTNDPFFNVPYSMTEGENTTGYDVSLEDFAKRYILTPEEKTESLIFETLMVYDIEVAGEKGVFPDPSKAEVPVIQISCCSGLTNVAKPTRNIVLCLRETKDIKKTPDPDIKAEIKWFHTEVELLEAFRDHIVNEVDPDVISGWNIEDFDFQYIVTRVERMHYDSSLLCWSRLAHYQTRNYQTVFESSAYGRRESNRPTIYGRCIMDGMEQYKRNFKLRSYKLDDVAFKFLGVNKEDVHHSMITPMWNADSLQRSKLALYCLMDSVLVFRLLLKHQRWMEVRALSFVAGVPAQATVSRGQSIRVDTMLQRECQSGSTGNYYLTPYEAHEGDPAWRDPETGEFARPVAGRAAEIHAQAIADGTIATSASRAREIGFQGATVVEPKRGFYNVPIATLDFEGLYPSFMRKWELCFVTLVEDPKEVEHLDPQRDLTVTPAGHTFVKPHVRRGLLPTILEGLYHARKAAKREMFEMERRGDKNGETVANSKQLALKITSNSIYGYTGATTSKNYRVQISESVTAYGRQGIETCTEATRDFDPGYTVVYGDTDSVMVDLCFERDFGKDFRERMSLKDILKEAQSRAVELNDFINQRFERPINLEFEKIFYPYLLVNKKRYAAMHYEGVDEDGHLDPSKGYLDVKGMESTRRDNAVLTAETLKHCLEVTLKENDVHGAIAYARGIIEDLVEGRVGPTERITYDHLVISKAYAKPHYKTPQPHSELVRRMKERGETLYHVSIGDRVPFVICAPSNAYSKGTDDNASMRSEDPTYAQEHGLPIDALYYIQQQLLKPLVRIFTPVLGSEDEVIRTLLGKLRTTIKPKQGIVHKRLSSEVRGALFGGASFGMGKKGTKDPTKNTKAISSYFSRKE